MPERIRFEREMFDLGLAMPKAYHQPSEREFEKGDATGQIKFGAEIDLAELKTEKSTKYGKWTIFATVKTTAAIAANTGLPVGASTTFTSKRRDGVSEKGAKQGFGYSGFKDLLKGIKIENLSINLSGEWSGLEIGAFAEAKFDVVNSLFGRFPAKLSFSIFKIKEGESLKIGEVESYFDTPFFNLKLPGVATKVFIRYKVRWALDKKQVGKEIVKKLAEKKLKDEMKKRGLIWLGGNAGKTVVKRLGPVVAAFSIGWDIGTFLNDATVADEVAGDVQKLILGDLSERYHQKGTLGKMFLIARNAPKILAALVASGIIGTMAGIGDLILFKIFGLDKFVANFEKIYETFRELKKIIPNVGQAIGDMILGTAFKIGVKLNPKYSVIPNQDLRIFAAAISKVIKPIYREKGGLQKFIDLKIQDIYVDEKIDYHRRVVDFIVKHKLSYQTINGNATRNEVFTQFLEANLLTFVGLLEKYKLISYKINIPDELGTAVIGQELVDELFI